MMGGGGIRGNHRIRPSLYRAGFGLSQLPQYLGDQKIDRHDRGRMGGHPFPPWCSRNTTGSDGKRGDLRLPEETCVSVGEAGKYFPQRRNDPIMILGKSIQSLGQLFLKPLYIFRIDFVLKYFSKNLRTQCSFHEQLIL
jgi:hypothetical protein